MAESALAEKVDDLIVAAVAAISAIGLAVSLRYGVHANAGILVEMVPLYLYFVYLFIRNSIGGTNRTTTWTWSALIVIVSAGIFLFYAA